MVVQKVNVNVLSHFAVERRHDLVAHLYDRDLQAAARQILGHFESDEPAADNDCFLCVGFFESTRVWPGCREWFEA